LISFSHPPSNSPPFPKGRGGEKKGCSPSDSCRRGRRLLYFLPLLWRGRSKVGEISFYFPSPSYILPLPKGKGKEGGGSPLSQREGERKQEIPSDSSRRRKK
ncbi:hypothetical protein J7J41_00080, partial [bacterium]|nr:hypothetical protein [bacterium]